MAKPFTDGLAQAGFVLSRSSFLGSLLVLRQKLVYPIPSMSSPDLTQTKTENAKLTSGATVMHTNYSNMIRGLLTAEEVVLDFGFNPGNGGTPAGEVPDFHSRIILGFSSALRLHQLLHALLEKRQEAVQQALTQEQVAKSGSDVEVFGTRPA